ncbi:MAG TPA: hypothetical protein DD643_03250, partial [Synechococcus sp. UBA8638]|nr:hypothetical protein [Synechococcus sp. UBA8638]
MLFPPTPMVRVVVHLVAALLAVVVTLTGCSGADAHGLTGRYMDDTLVVITELRQAVEVEVDDPGYRQAGGGRRGPMKEYTSPPPRHPPRQALRSVTP